jgi:hypothetical protein
LGISGWGIPKILLFGAGSTRDEVIVRSFLEKCHYNKQIIIKPLLENILRGFAERRADKKFNLNLIEFEFSKTNLYVNSLDVYRSGLISPQTALSVNGFDYEKEKVLKQSSAEDKELFAPVDVNFAGRDKGDKDVEDE